jgi:hypothetical protein
MFHVKKQTRNTHVLELNTKSKHQQIANLSDVHWDNPKCDRRKLKEDMDYCLKNNIPVFINGDFFCMMQGKYDPRRSKKDILPEHNVANYIDAVIEDAVEWFTPYASILTVIGYGNHETAIVKNLETDPLQRFVDLFNYKNKDNQIYTGGYGGWLVIKSKDCLHAGYSRTMFMRYFHGSGGGGVVTRGEINLTRALEMYEGMDIFTMGHIHENKATAVVRDSFSYNKGSNSYEQSQKEIHLMITGTYKEEYADGFGGWHVERGAPIKPTGGRIINIYHYEEKSDLARRYKFKIDSQQFPKS